MSSCLSVHPYVCKHVCMYVHIYIYGIHDLLMLLLNTSIGMRDDSTGGRDIVVGVGRADLENVVRWKAHTTNIRVFPIASQGVLKYEIAY